MAYFINSEKIVKLEIKINDVRNIGLLLKTMPKTFIKYHDKTLEIGDVRFYHKALTLFACPDPTFLEDWRTARITRRPIPLASPPREIEVYCYARYLCNEGKENIPWDVTIEIYS